VLTTTLSIIAVLLGMGGGSCQPGYFPTYPGVEVREALFVGIDLSEDQCRVLEDMTTALHRRMRSMNAEWATKGREERRQKVKELYYEHALKAAAVAVEGQAERIATNLNEVREMLYGTPSAGG